jgi:peptide/nickel transport system substrate-binding protein
MRLIGLAVVLALSLTLAPLAGEAQPGKVFRVGFLTAFSNSADSPLFDSFRQGMRELGYEEGRNIEGLIREQAVERDPKRREATLHRIQQLMHERVMFAPIWQLAVLHAYGSRVAEPALGLVAGHQFTAPYEEVRLKVR